ncbi:PREDICTED: farnesol dehydrogenase isoform X2 [Bactrocera latifrons]|uniref:farnesol dehydrogenase isoform X2 n=1 Tax=Bactrocera latifrons TaxID=174628 RepID=UPI0008DE609F|nr:PREDICTED: farnesol dehydrogenase isoform X2 [Bactrocera latifrons]XP_018785369.1 PREDICTED: farnesol dehydrogenase isoform X2 [Bactrocera latifrons]
MERWQNRVAAVTGASSGIGAATVKDLLKANLIVVGLARRLERMEELKAQLTAEQQNRFHAVACDVSSQESVDTAFDWIIKELGGVDILINNAGIFAAGQASTQDPVELERVLQINVMGTVYCTQRAFKSMKERNFDGHVVVVNSVLGHSIPMTFGNNQPPRLSIYPSSKYAVTALTEILRQEFRGLNTKIKITSVSPGLTDTEIVPDVFKGDKTPILKSEDVSSCILFTLSTPPHMQVHEIIVKPLLGE